MTKFQEDRSPKVIAFIEEIVGICKKHNLCISHEEGHGSFEIDTYFEYTIQWFKDAGDNTENECAK